MKRSIKSVLTLFIGLLATFSLRAQVDDKYKDYREVYRDSVLVADTRDIIVMNEGQDPFTTQLSSISSCSV